uniref:Uncharacterized protein n=1 Tax=Brassica oleracea TaxID=3712 RepID=A0A3P6G1A3_BRAOL|nr:unnamed protein product [Brassica oleracea]
MVLVDLWLVNQVVEGPWEQVLRVKDLLEIIDFS